MTREEMKERRRAYYEAHKDEMKAYQKSYDEAHKAQKIAYYKAHKAEDKAYQKAYREAHKAEAKAYREAHKAEAKAYREAHREEIKAYKRAYNKDYQKSDTNSLGQTKNSIRLKSSYYLFNVLKHTKLNGYEIHHCFGYDDYRNFIYIPKALHLQIHQYLRDNNIDADTDHYNKIVHLIIACEEYVYIKA